MLRQAAGRFVTLAIARLELAADGSVLTTVSSGGHPLPRILRSTALVEEIGITGTLLGVLEDVDFEDRAAVLAPADALVLYTDGLTEVGAPHVWSRTHLDRAIAGARRQDAAGIVSWLASQADAEAEGPPRDDVALLVLRSQPLLYGST
jgi:serine phosphatase RsbU (regulator of sigma subunit)